MLHGLPHPGSFLLGDTHRSVLLPDLHEVEEAIQHGDPAPGALSSDFLASFLARALENWQSEFLQMASFVVLATYFIHRGSPQSRDRDDEMAADIKAIKKKLDA